MPAKKRNSQTPPTTIQKMVQGNDTMDTPLIFARPSSKSKNFIMSPEVHARLNELFQDPEVSKKLFGTEHDDSGSESQSDQETAEEKKEMNKLKRKRQAHLQDKRASKITYSLKAHDAMEAVRCLHEIEKAHKLQGENTYDVDAMVQTTRDKASDSIQQLIEKQTTNDYDDWIKLCVQILHKLFGGEQYTTALCDAIESRVLKQSNNTVAEYIDAHAPALNALRRAYERDDDISLRETGQMEAHFTTRWIDGLAPDLCTTLPTAYQASLINGAQRLEFDSVCQQALVEERVKRKHNKGRTATTGAVVVSGYAHDGQVDEKTATNAFNEAVGSIVQTATAAIASAASFQPPAASFQPQAANYQSQTGSVQRQPQSTPANGQMHVTPFQRPGNKKICFYCQRKNLPCDHDHLFCPVRLSSASGGAWRARGQGNVTVPGPPPGAPPRPAARFGNVNTCFRCGGDGHRAPTCVNPCKVCRVPGKNQHAPGCTNIPRWMREQGNGYPARS